MRVAREERRAQQGGGRRRRGAQGRGMAGVFPASVCEDETEIEELRLVRTYLPDLLPLASPAPGATLVCVCAARPRRLGEERAVLFPRPTNASGAPLSTRLDHPPLLPPSFSYASPCSSATLQRPFALFWRAGRSSADAWCRRGPSGLADGATCALGLLAPPGAAGFRDRAPRRSADRTRACECCGLETRLRRKPASAWRLRDLVAFVL